MRLLSWVFCFLFPVLLNAAASEAVRNSVNAVAVVIANNSQGHAVSQGSGFFISADGHLVTNWHVVENAQTITIRLPSGIMLAAEKPIAVECAADLALFKASIRGFEVPYLSLASIENTKIGDDVFAVGNPLLSQSGSLTEATLSDGIISGIREMGSGVTAIQTTAPVSPGNSGGPLLNDLGEVVGVITFGLTEGQNLNFAVAALNVLPLLEQRQAESVSLDACANREFVEGSDDFTLDGIYSGEWLSRGGSSGYALMTIAVSGEEVSASLTIIGSPVGYEGDEMVGRVIEIGQDSWTIDLEATNSRLEARAIIRGNTFLGDYTYRKGLFLRDRGQWILERN